VKVGDLVKRKRAVYEDNKYLNSNVGLIVKYDRTLACVKWITRERALWIDPNNIEIINESR